MGGPLAPFRHRTFALLWAAALLSSIGTWFRDVANGWVMAGLTPSPLMVALVQAAGTLPVFLLSLPAGALADIVDRRRLLVAVQIWLVAVSLALAAAAALEVMTPALLLALTLAGGVGAALIGPAWQGIVPEIVPRAELRPAVALNSIGVNVARAIGPALGGWILALAGAAVAYLLDALSTLAIVAVLLLWRRVPRSDKLGPERFGPALAAGVRYVIESPEIRRALLRSATFFVFASAYWALLPLVARDVLGGDARLYGALLGAAGLGAVSGAFLLPRLARGRPPGAVVYAGTLLTAVSCAALALLRVPALAMLALFVAGAAWIAVLTTLNVLAQSVLPDWVRARGLAVYLTAFFGAMTFGAALWGQAASLAGVPAALLAAALGGVLAGTAVLRVALPRGDVDLTPSLHWPEPALAAEPEPDRGPVLVEVAYRVAPERRAAFLAALAALARTRRRDGAYGWHVLEDTADPEAVTEIFFLPSWRDHLRQHARVTRADAAVQAAVVALHEGPAPPAVRHLLAIGRDPPRSP